MPRPKKMRSVQHPPLISDFKPTGIRARDLEALDLALDEFEAIRLADFQGLDHAESAEQMGISRPTFSRLIDQARHKLAVFLVEGRHLRIEGGDIHFQRNMIRCQGCGHLFNTSLDADMEECPRCGSPHLVDLAGGHGHGRCCRSFHQHSRRNNNA